MRHRYTLAVVVMVAFAIVAITAIAPLRAAAAADDFGAQQANLIDNDTGYTATAPISAVANIKDTGYTLASAGVIGGPNITFTSFTAAVGSTPASSLNTAPAVPVVVGYTGIPINLAAFDTGPINLAISAAFDATPAPSITDSAQGGEMLALSHSVPAVVAKTHHARLVTRGHPAGTTAETTSTS